MLHIFLFLIILFCHVVFRVQRTVEDRSKVYFNTLAAIAVENVCQLLDNIPLCITDSRVSEGGLLLSHVSEVTWSI